MPKSAFETLQMRLIAGLLGALIVLPGAGTGAGAGAGVAAISVVTDISTLTTGAPAAYAAKHSKSARAARRAKAAKARRKAKARAAKKTTKKTASQLRAQRLKRQELLRLAKNRAARLAAVNLLRNVKTWAYQLQGAQPGLVAASPVDLMVIDYSRAGSGGGRYGRREMRRMKRKPDGSRRLLLAYISIGEAEDYRFYWRDAWVETLKLFPAPAAKTRGPALQFPSTDPSAGAPPAGASAITLSAPIPARPKPILLRVPKLSAPTWLGRENQSWSGNYAVRYWDPSWQKLIFGGRRSYLERIIKAGFDGIYIDRVDAYYDLPGRRRAAREMAKFVINLARHARKLKPDFLVVPQNAEELLLKPSYLAQIDGIAKEDLFFGSDGDGEANSWASTHNSLAWLGASRKRKLPVFIVEYLDDPKLVAAADEKIKAKGFIGYFGPRSLDRLVRREDLLPPVPPAPVSPTAVPPPPAATGLAPAKAANTAAAPAQNSPQPQ